MYSGTISRMSARRVLLVDDERDVTDAVKIGLEQYGFKVDAYYDPVKALADFRPGIYDVIISDIKMPHMNGFQMVYEMQRIDGECEVLFLTGHVDMYEELSKLFDKMNVREVIRKPLAIKQLVDKIHSLESLPASSRTTNSRRSLELVFAKSQRKEGSNHLSQEPPRKELLDLILKTVSRGRATLGNIAQQMRPRIDFKWDEFIGAVNYLVSKGQLQSKGDGFEVLYSITEEGEKDIQ